MPAKKKSGRLILYSVLVLILLVVTGVYLLEHYLEGRIRVLLKEKIEQATNGKYSVSTGSLQVNLLSRSIHIKDLVFAPIGDNNTGEARYVLRSGVLHINGISVLSYLQKKDVIIHSITFDDPQVYIFQARYKIPFKEKNNDAFSIFRAISPGIHSLFVEEIDILKSQFGIYKNGPDTIPVLSAKENSIFIRKLSINEKTDQAHRLFFAERFDIVMDRFSYHLDEGLYTLFGKKLTASYTDSLITIDSFQLVPNYSKKDFTKIAGRQISRVEIIFTEVGLTKMDVKSFLELNSLNCEKLEAKGGAINVYRDNNVPLASIKRPTVQEIIRDFPFALSIDSVLFKNAKAVAEVIADGEVNPGKVTLSSISGIITGVQNDSSNYTDSTALIISLQALMFGEGRFNAVYSFPLKTRKEVWYSKGSLSSLSFQKLNSMAVNTRGIFLKSGKIDSMYFNLYSNGSVATGKMVLAYHDLEVEMTDEPQKSIAGRLKNFAANKLILKDSNPGKNGLLREVPMMAARNPYRYFPFFFAQSLLSGVDATIEGKEKSIFLKRTGLLEKK
jgi:hypothetical protein